MENLLLALLMGSAHCAVLLRPRNRVCVNSTRIVEDGAWRPELRKLDGAIVDNPAHRSREQQVYVYENRFPHHTIHYVSVDNIAHDTCGAAAEIVRGGVGTSEVTVLLRAQPHREIRSVVDVWGLGKKRPSGRDRLRDELAERDEHYRRNKSYYLFKDVGALNRNRPAEAEAEAGKRSRREVKRRDTGAAAVVSGSATLCC